MKRRAAVTLGAVAVLALGASSVLTFRADYVEIAPAAGITTANIYGGIRSKD